MNMSLQMRETSHIIGIQQVEVCVNLQHITNDLKTQLTHFHEIVILAQDRNLKSYW